jgi:pilus assembly protein CpaB
MRGKSLALLLLALGCGLIASIGVTQAISKRDKPVSEDVENVLVVVKNVPLGDLLNAEVLKEEAWPKGKVPVGALSKIEDVEGRRARTQLWAGELVLDNKLSRKGASNQGADALIPKGYRVVPVKVDAVSGGAGLLLPGNRVDVMVFLTQNPQWNIVETATRTVLQDIKVFAVNEVVSLQSPNDKDPNKSTRADTVSLLVTPEQAAKLTLAASLGQIKLIMRGPEDDQDPGRSDATPAALFGAKDAGSRGRETLLDQSEKEMPGRGFLEMLAGAKTKVGDTKTKPAEETPVAPTTVSWTIRMLQPGEVSDMVLEADANEVAIAGQSPGFSRWHVAGGTAAAQAEKSKPTPAEEAKGGEDAGPSQQPVPVKPEA